MIYIRTFIILVLFLGGIPSALGQVDVAQLRATFISKFIGFTQWPNEASKTSFKVLIYDTDQNNITGIVKAFEAAQLKIQILSNKSNESPDIVIFVTGTIHERKQIATQYPKALLVSHNEGALRDQFHINFFEQDTRLRFEINIQAAKARGFEFSSQMLKLAKIWEGD